MTLTSIILTIIWVTSLVVLLFIVFRNSKVARFRIKIIQEDYERGVKAIEDGSFSDFTHNYDKLPSYDKMVFSFKPLEKKYWL